MWTFGDKGARDSGRKVADSDRNFGCFDVKLRDLLLGSATLQGRKNNNLVLLLLRSDRIYIRPPVFLCSLKH